MYADGKIRWTTGDSSGGANGIGGIPAQVGFNAGDGFNFASVPESRTQDIINIDNTTNVGIKGVWMFQVNEERISAANGRKAVVKSLYMYTFSFLLLVPSGAVTNLDARNIDPTTVELSWGPVMDEEQNGNILSYNIYYRLNSSSGFMVIRNVINMVCK